MPENIPPTGEVQATPPVTPQAGETPPQPQPQAGDGKDYEKIISELRKENASHRTKLTAFEKAQAAAEAATLSEVEKTAKRAEAAEAQVAALQAEKQSMQISLAAQKLGFANPELAAKLITLEADATPEEIATALRDLLKAEPYLAAPVQGQPAKAPQQPGMNGPRSQRVQPQQSMQEAFKSRQGLGVIFDKNNNQ